MEKHLLKNHVNNITFVVDRIISKIEELEIKIQFIEFQKNNLNENNINNYKHLNTIKDETNTKS